MSSSANFYESDVEEAAIAWFKAMGYPYAHGPSLTAERGDDPRQALLLTRLEAALRRLNPDLPTSALDEAIRRLRGLDSRNIDENNHAFHRMLTKGIALEVTHADGGQRGETVWLVDFQNPENNDWLVVNQLTLVGSKTRRPDVIVYINGLPIAVIELKDPTNPQAKVKGAYNQLQTYKAQIPQLFTANEILVASDGIKTRVGSLTAGWERFGPWRSIEKGELAPEAMPSLEVVIRGLFEKTRLLDYIRSFVLFETQDGIIKKIAGYHQYYAVNLAVEATARAVKGDGKVGVVWHTQGSGKSISMVFYAGKVIRHDATENPTLVVVTDRMDLDDQLFRQFGASTELLSTKPHQALSRDDLRDQLRVASGGVVFTTMQKFVRRRKDKLDDQGNVIARAERHYPCLSKRQNIIIIADEAHRTQYNFARGLADNLKRALPNASRIGFTGTPIAFTDRDTQALFGEYIDIYPLSQAVADESTVPIYYEARLARLELPEDEKPHVDEEFDDATEDESVETQEQLKRRNAKLEVLIDTKKRLKLIARDIVDHWRRRAEVLTGKGMVVTISRKVAVRLYNQIIRLHPHWHDDDVDKGAIKVVITGSAEDPPLLQSHIHTRKELDRIAARLKDADDPLQLVIVCDMWLTGFDAPPLHTMYFDKPLKGHTLMQAIARVNRVHEDKPSGLVVDYLGVAAELKAAIEYYDPKKQASQTEPRSLPIELALEELVKRHGIVRDMFHGFDYSGFFSANKPLRVQTLAAAENHILALEDGKKRYREAMAGLNKAAGLALHLESARHLRDDVAFFQAVQASLGKHTTPRGSSDEALNAAVRQIVSRAVVPDDEVLDLLGLAGVDKPDISILSEAFLESLRVTAYPDLQVEALNKLLKDEIRTIERRNVVQGRRFSERLQEAINKYQNRSLDAVQVIQELVELARAFRQAQEQGQKLGLNEAELAFYDALADHGDVRDLMGDTVLSEIAQQLVATIRKSVTLDWTQKENVRAKLRLKVKLLLKKFKYPPDQSEKAIALVIHQAETSCADWGVTELEEAPVLADAPAESAPESTVVQYPDPTPPVMVAADVAVAVPPLQFPMTGLWGEALEETAEDVHPFLRAAYDEGFPPPEYGWDWTDTSGRVEGSILELAWPERRVAVLTEGVSDKALAQMAERSWTVLRPPYAEDTFLAAMR